MENMRQKNDCRVALPITLAIAIIAVLLFFLSPVRADNGYGYGNALSISPTEVTFGEEVTVSVTLVNTGEVEETYEVVLKIDGVVEDTKEVSIGAGSSQTVTFTTSRDLAGTYAVSAGGLSGSFVVREGAPLVFNWWIIGGVIAAVVAAATVIWLSLIRKVE